MAMASLSYGNRVFWFRTNPNLIRWDYNLNTSVTQTYGGWVVQLLSANIDNLTVTADSGGGGWDYLYTAAQFFRDLLFDQKNGSQPAIFEYPNRNWKMGVYLANFPFTDNNLAVLRPFTLKFKVQEDISGIITTDSLIQEIQRLQQGIGWKHNDYNTPPFNPDDTNGTGPDEFTDERPQPITDERPQAINPPAPVTDERPRPIQ